MPGWGKCCHFIYFALFKCFKRKHATYQTQNKVEQKTNERELPNLYTQASNHTNPRSSSVHSLMNFNCLIAESSSGA